MRPTIAAGGSRKENARVYARDDYLDTYLGLVRAFPLLSIRDDVHLDAAIAQLHRVLAIAERSAGEEAYLGALTDLIETYENQHIQIRQPGGVEMVTHLMEQHGLLQKDMDFAFGNKAVTSAVLSGARPIGLTAARRLSERFHLPLDIFLARSDRAPRAGHTELGAEYTG
jgi:HTH-type transcriptional regulator/antitoxin HigA